MKLLAQTEVGEVAEASEGGRGGSSTLPHKRNPVGAALAIACARGVRGAASVLLGAMAQEHERAAGAWQAEWEALSRRARADRAAPRRPCARRWRASRCCPERMRANLELTGGLLMTEAVTTALADRLGRAEAEERRRRRGTARRPRASGRCATSCSASPGRPLSAGGRSTARSTRPTISARPRPSSTAR